MADSTCSFLVCLSLPNSALRDSTHLFFAAALIPGSLDAMTMYRRASVWMSVAVRSKLEAREAGTKNQVVVGAATDEAATDAVVAVAVIDTAGAPKPGHEAGVVPILKAGVSPKENPPEELGIGIEKGAAGTGMGVGGASGATRRETFERCRPSTLSLRWTCPPPCACWNRSVRLSAPSLAPVVEALASRTPPPSLSTATSSWSFGSSPEMPWAWIMRARC
mmetsp:Transcript_24452/g.50547  ORF Transcript_24452/g.50547 Transcript_24452/m.50547 type:complete len:221 (+) Transcript_24452:1655-2317(+)